MSAPRQTHIRRPLHAGDSLRRLLAPRSVCIIGASERAGNFGGLTLENLRAFEGTVTAVHPTLREVLGFPCHPSLSDVPEAPDCIAVCTPMSTVEGLIDEAAALGVGGAVVYASGYAEIGPKGEAAQAALAAQAERTGVRILGPNCLGYINNVSRAAMTFNPGILTIPHHPGGVGIVSQSGALRDVFIHAQQRGMGISHLLSAGNSADVDVWDLVSFLVDDPDTSVIACLFEGVKDGARLREVGARAQAAGKTIVAYNAATGEHSKRAAASHTGSMAAPDAVVHAALTEAGVVPVPNIEDLCPMAAFFAKAPKMPTGRSAFALSTSGGACVIAASKAEEAGVLMTPPNAEMTARMRAVLPDFVEPSNPCDVTAMVLATPTVVPDCLATFLESPDYAAGAFVLPTFIDGGPSERRVEMLSEIAAAHPDKAFALVWMVEWGDAPPTRMAEVHPNLIIFRSMRQCMEAFAAFLARGETHEAAPRLTEPAAQRPEGPLDERAAKALLARYGIGVTREAVVPDADAAVAFAREQGRPIAMKVSSPHIAHKTEVGGVRLNLSDEAKIRAAFDALREITERFAPQAPFEGVLVQEMLPEGVEMIVGGFVDPIFGPVVSVGAGGVQAEVWKDQALALAPVTLPKAREMIASLKSSVLLAGFRGAPAADVEAVAQAVVRASEFLFDAQDWVAELDVNPLIAGPSGASAADALIVPAEADASAPADKMETTK